MRSSCNLFSTVGGAVAGAKGTTGAASGACRNAPRPTENARGRSLLLRWAHRAAGAPVRTRASRGGVGDAGLRALLGLIAGRHGLVGAIHRRSRPFQAEFSGAGRGRGGSRQGEGR